MLWSVILLTVSVGGCSTNFSRHTLLHQPSSAKPPDCSIEVFRNTPPPTRPYEVVSRLDVHIEHSYVIWIRPTFDTASEALKNEACTSGADAVIDLEERSWSLVGGQTQVYHLTAKGIRYKE